MKKDKPSAAEIQALLTEFPRLDWLICETLLMCDEEDLAALTRGENNVCDTAAKENDGGREAVSPDLRRQRGQYDGQPREGETFGAEPPVQCGPG